MSWPCELTFTIKRATSFLLLTQLFRKTGPEVCILKLRGFISYSDWHETHELAPATKIDRSVSDWEMLKRNALERRGPLGIIVFQAAELRACLGLQNTSGENIENAREGENLTSSEYFFVS